jgi:iron(III) transport system substrate-binding protein
MGSTDLHTGLARLARGLALAVALLAGAASGCRDRSPAKPEVVVYTALDREFSEPILQRFQDETGIRALVVYDTESTKTVGLVNRIRAERSRPRCDVFWNNEILNTLRLKEEGLLRPTQPTNAALYPEDMRDKEGTWYGFAARARIILVNTSLVRAEQVPRSMNDLLDSRWRGRIGIAKPVAGTTATHVACLFALLGDSGAKAYFRGLKRNGVRLESGNRACAEDVSAGRLAAAWTDTDDAMLEVAAGKPVTVIYPDDGPDGIGTLFIPNTLAAIKNSPNPREADRLIDYLLSPEVEGELARSASAQIPLNRTNKQGLPVRRPGEVRAMRLDAAQAVAAWTRAQEFIATEILQ